MTLLRGIIIGQTQKVFSLYNGILSTLVLRAAVVTAVEVVVVPQVTQEKDQPF